MAGTPTPDSPTLDMRGVTPDGETLRPPGAAAPVSPERGRPFGRYLLLDELGRGGMGVVWKAWDPALQRVVALKMIGGEGGLDPHRTARFAREAQAAARLRHPNVIAVHDVGVEAGQQYIVTEYVLGGSLESRLHGPMEVRPAVELVRSVAEALHYAHRQGIIHRDVKPANILVDDSSRPYVMDFGLARQVDQPEGTHLTVSGDLLGTPSYMSPEQASGKVGLHGPATDQFSLGVVLYQLLTGRLPFEADSFQGLLNAITDRDPPRPRSIRADLPVDLETICLKALEKDPARRYVDLGEMSEDLGRILGGEPIRARGTGSVSRFLRAARRHRGIAALSAIALVVLLAVPYLWRRAEEEAERRRRSDEALRKGGLVQGVFLRWARLTEPLRRLEALHYAPSGDPSARQAAVDAAWPEIEAFRRETPPDATSQSAMLALAGWARWLAGPEEEGIAWMRKARELDPDLPYGALLEALTCLSRYLLELQPDSLQIGLGELDYGRVSKEGPELRELGERIVGLLDEASRAGVWGDRVGDDAKRMLEAMRAFHGRRYDDAERALTAALAGSSMQLFENELLMARSSIRVLRKSFDGAASDVERIRAAHPNQAFVEVALGLVHGAEAMELLRTEDRRALALPALQKTLSHLSRAVEQDPMHRAAWFYRGVAYWGLGEVHAWLGMDPRLALAQSIADLTKALPGAPNRGSSVLEARGLAWLSRGRDAARRGTDASRAFAEAVEDFGAALATEPTDRQDLERRGCVLLEWGAWETAHGKDGRRLLEAAIADFSSAAGIDASATGPRRSRAIALDRLADAGGPTSSAERELRERAVADLTWCIVREPGNWRARYSRGMILRKLGRIEEALADLEAAQAASGGRANVGGLIEQLRAR